MGWTFYTSNLPLPGVVGIKDIRLPVWYTLDASAFLSAGASAGFLLKESSGQRRLLGWDCIETVMVPSESGACGALRSQQTCSAKPEKQVKLWRVFQATYAEVEY